MKKILTYYLLLLSLFSHSQNVRTEYPVVYNELDSQTPLFHPAFIQTPEDYSFTFNLNHQGRTALQKNIKNNFFQIENRSSKLKNQYIGLNFSRQQTSKIISRNRLHLNYKYNIQLSENHSLALGTTIGIYNFSIKDNPTGVKGSSTVPDANIGAFYKCKNLEAALSINQFLNRKLKPLQNEYLLKRYYSAFILYDFPISQKQSYLRTQIIYNHYGRQNDFASSINYIHLKKYGIGLSYRRYGGISLLFKLSKITLSKGNELNLGLSASLLAINSISREYQISLTYRLGHLSPHKN